MRYATAVLPLLFAVAAFAQQPRWQNEIEDDKGRAARGQTTTFAIPPGAKVQAKWPPGLYEYYNGTRPFCYAYVISGDWKVGPGPTVYSQDGRMIASVRFRPPSDFRGVTADNLPSAHASSRFAILSAITIGAAPSSMSSSSRSSPLAGALGYSKALQSTSARAVRSFRRL